MAIPLRDDTVLLATEGYAWLPNRRRAAGESAGGGVLTGRLFGRRMVALCGPDAARFFSQEAHVRRGGVLPGPLLDTLVGRDAVHTLDGRAHRRRAELFAPLLRPDTVDALVEAAVDAWDETIAGWSPGRPVTVFDEAARVLTRAVCRWAGVPLADADVPALAADLVALVEGFGPGPRHWRARRARARRERWLADLVEGVRRGTVQVPDDSTVRAIALRRAASDPSPSGRPSGRPSALPAGLAAIELLNVLRPTVAVAWFVTFAGHALHRWPAHRVRVREDGSYAEAFAHEVRRFYPFAPFVAGRAATDLVWHGEPIPRGALMLLDLYGQNHDPRRWPQPYEFRPDRFLGPGPTHAGSGHGAGRGGVRRIGAFELVPQGAGEPLTGHRCPGEAVTVGLLRALASRLAALNYTVPGQDLRIPLGRIPTRPRDGLVIVPGIPLVSPLSPPRSCTFQGTFSAIRT